MATCSSRGTWCSRAATTRCLRTRRSNGRVLECDERSFKRGGSSEGIDRQSGGAVLLVEQRVAEALGACDYGYVLESGHLVLEGSHDTLLADEKVKRAYLGM